MIAAAGMRASAAPRIGSRSMRILLISYWFPPSNVIGAVRAGKLARYMREAGHDVRILAGPALPPLGLALEIPETLVSRPEVPSAGAPTRSGVRAALRARADALGLTSGRVGKVLREHLYAAIERPDKHAGWIEPALALARTLLRDWRPELILASAPPYSGLLVAARLAAESRIPWVAEMRDPWSGNVYNDRPAWRDWIDRRIERRILGSATALVAVSPVVGRDLKSRFKRPVATVLNGFAPEDLPPSAARAPGTALEIVYTGTIYEGHRDPSALFAAIARLPSDLRRDIHVTFYGPGEAQVRELADPHGVAAQVRVMAPVDYRTSLERQAQADVLLLLQRDDPSDEGNLPAKFFEYLGALRPILLLGYERGVLADMIRERGAGLVANAPAVISSQLETWIAQARAGGVPALGEGTRAGLSRAEQFAEYEAFLRDRLAEARS